VNPQTFVLQARLCARATALKVRMTEAHDQAKGLIERAEGCLAVLDHLGQSTAALANISPNADVSLFIRRVASFGERLARPATNVEDATD
jgi:hypothetical protein